MDNVGVVLFGITGFFTVCYKFGRWSVNQSLILSKDNHEELIEEIDNKIEEIEVYNNLSIWNQKKD